MENPWGWIFLEKLIVIQLVKNFPLFYRMQRFTRDHPEQFESDPQNHTVISWSKNSLPVREGKGSQDTLIGPSAKSAETSTYFHTSEGQSTKDKL
jgi:hypothetical protein